MCGVAMVGDENGPSTGDKVNQHRTYCGLAKSELFGHGGLKRCRP